MSADTQIAGAAPPAAARLLPLYGQVQNYAWGSPDAIYDLLGEPPGGQPAAELWLGTHPVAPAEVDDAGRRRPAVELVGELPFLLKVLAAEKALSLQVHPDLATARAGFDAEERAGVPRDAPRRRYRDPNHKPELIVALTPFRALAGIREPRRTLAVVEALGVDGLTAAFRPLAADPARGAAAVLRTLLTLPRERGRALAGELTRAATGVAARAQAAPDLVLAADLVGRLAVAHPGDVGIAAALLLNDVTLRPGEALFQPARLLHAYVHGVGIEIMATSDNVLRGGLTPKHIDVDELLRLLDPAPSAAPVLAAKTLRAGAGGLVRYWPVPVDDFVLAEAICAGGEVTLNRPAVLLAVDGAVDVRVASAPLAAGAAEAGGERAGLEPAAEPSRLARGQAAVLTAPATVTLSGAGRVFAARPGTRRPA
ncbi:mannose-6-phosphate isomerase, class I [Frankia sp. CNm7]|uniref:mannose-6-phosphate isomerase n=1 Tax=Frankia nepalensis TaxID=1836974 RepID=A0A937RHH7_9ACTN|nr:mannose-6-phosphate isomerase, class I [Frankia nepalensis]MBL7496886.1 mannose-6-phosphate isomerase, class I [Frankia nepalensis]MBL7512086.1 mannose-6-phosphate isomerase, class I [Frankia nepalensis]MBL7521848.1 mannose-6-phosphate isomerase, class I [Frankia nepalensis]MBL7630455.1 mannose-6-phosphate isomerase, class I [Frankia nepalensis]